MQFWFARGSEVSIREQLVTQVVLGILSDDSNRASDCPALAIWHGAFISTRTQSAPDIASSNAIAGSSSAGAAASTFVPTSQRLRPRPHWRSIK
jgi:hypothetical protein